MPNRYNESIKNYAINLYKEGNSAAAIAREIGANEVTIRNWLKQFGIEIRAGAEYSLKYNEVFAQRVNDLYANGLETPQIDKMLGFKRGISSYLLRKYGYDIKHRGPKSKIGREDFFDSIDVEEKAYFLGWLMADGNVSIYNNQYSIKVHVALKDRDVVDKFLKTIECENKTNVKEGTNPSYYVSLTSKHMCESLIKLGVVPNKSAHEIFPKQIDKDLAPHFIRGVFDGDGITDIKRKRSGFVGSYDMLTSILISINVDNITIFQHKRSNNIYYFLGGKKFSRLLYEYMYKDATVWLNRKRERLEQICDK